MIEIENIDEVLNGMREKAERNPNSSLRVETVSLDEGTLSVRQILERCVTDADHYENVVVIRFTVSPKHEGEGCRATGDTRMSVHGPHAALHGVELIEETVRALKEKILETFLDDLLRGFGDQK